jgi:hypothetical protein
MASIFRDLGAARLVGLGALLMAVGGGLWWRGGKLHQGPGSAARLIATEVPQVPPARRPWQRSCPAAEAAPREAVTPKRDAFTLAEVVVPPGASGPYIREWAYRAAPRSSFAIEDSLSKLAAEMTGCYPFARQRSPELAETLQGRLTIDEWGFVAAVSLAGSPRAAEAARCFEGILLGRDFSGHQTRLPRLLSRRGESCLRLAAREALHPLY